MSGDSFAVCCVLYEEGHDNDAQDLYKSMIVMCQMLPVAPEARKRRSSGMQPGKRAIRRFQNFKMRHNTLNDFLMLSMKVWSSTSDLG